MDGGRRALIGDETLIHLRTGKRVDHAWLRVGQHLDEWPSWPSDRPRQGAVLHVPRVRIDQDVRSVLQITASRRARQRLEHVAPSRRGGPGGPDARARAPGPALRTVPAVVRGAPVSSLGN